MRFIGVFGRNGVVDVVILWWVCGEMRGKAGQLTDTFRAPKIGHHSEKYFSLGRQVRTDASYLVTLCLRLCWLKWTGLENFSSLLNDIELVHIEILELIHLAAQPPYLYHVHLLRLVQAEVHS